MLINNPYSYNPHMNITVTLDPATRAILNGAGIDAESFCVRAARSYLRQCQDAAAVLRILEGHPPSRPEERWASELAAREPTVNALKGKR